MKAKTKRKTYAALLTAPEPALRNPSADRREQVRGAAAREDGSVVDVRLQHLPTQRLHRMPTLRKVLLPGLPPGRQPRNRALRELRRNCTSTLPPLRSRTAGGGGGVSGIETGKQTNDKCNYLALPCIFQHFSLDPPTHIEIVLHSKKLRAKLIKKRQFSRNNENESRSFCQLKGMSKKQTF